MTLTELRYVVAVAQQRHFGQAAKSCFVSQPTLSVAIKRLEDELGVTLFERSRNEITLTPIGERIVYQAQRVLTEADTIRELAKSGRNELSGPLRIGAIYTVAPYLLPQLIPLMNRLAPEIPLLVEENYAFVISDKLRRGDLDLAVVALPFDEPGIFTQPIYEEPFVVLLPADHELARENEIALRRLEEETVLLPGVNHCMRDHVLEFCPNCYASTKENASLQKTLDGASLETIRMMVTGGVGISIVPCTAAGPDRTPEHLLATRPFSDINPSRQVALAWRNSFPRTKVIEVVKQAITDCPLSGVQKI
jgi:LysR family transcriptional regulator, hydrogen peroxide-inducible genes activator